MVMAMKPEDFISERRAVTAPASNLLIEIPAGGIISGRVVDKASKEPLTSFRAGPSNTRRGAGWSLPVRGCCRRSGLTMALLY